MLFAWPEEKISTKGVKCDYCFEMKTRNVGKNAKHLGSNGKLI